MRDFLGKELYVGDKVVWYEGGRYPTIWKAKVEAFTPAMVKIMVYTKVGEPTNVGTVNHHKLVKVEW